MSDTVRARSHTHRRILRLTLLLTACLLIIANGVVALILVGQLRQSTAQMERTLQAIVTEKEIEDLVEDSGEHQRKYRVFGDARELESYRTLRAELPAELQRLDRLTAPDPSNSTPTDRLSSLVEQDTTALAASLAPIDLSIGAAAVRTELAPSIERTDSIVAVVNELIEDEQVELRKRAGVVAWRNAAALATSVLAAIGSVVLIGIIFALTRRDLRRSELVAETQSGALRESEQRLYRIFEESPLGIVLADPDTQRIAQTNPAFGRMLGFDISQIVGRTIPELTHIDDKEVLSDAIRDGSGPDLDIETRYVTRSGAIAWARARLTQLSALDGRPGLLLALIEDITREKRAEAELRQAQKMEAIGQLTGGIAHDFNNLLGVIIGNVEFLIDTAIGADQANLAREILNSALSGADLTRRLLAFARRQPLQPRRIDLNAYLPNHIAILGRLLGESIAIITDLAEDLWPTRADPSQVGDAVLNLAINARDAMPHGGAITIGTANIHREEDDPDSEMTAGDYVVLSVTDSGTGMSPEVLERAVEPFFTTKEPGAGSGLGLSMIFGFAKQSGGHLQIDSEPGHGTTVRLYLPRALGPERYQAHEPADARSPHGNESILLVDDSAEMRNVTRRHLVSLGYTVSEAGSGPAAMERLLEGNIFDLLLTDVVMPGGMTGYQLAAAARPLRPGLKVVFVTGYTWPDPTDVASGSMAGAVIRKPYRLHELAATVRAALNN